MMDTIMDVSEIIDSFDVTEIRKLIYEQIPLEKDADVFMDITTDHFKPIYGDYRNALQNSPEEFHQEITEKFQEVCSIYIDRICKKFDLSIDTTWMEDNISRLPVITLTLYSFFVLDFSNNLQEVLLKYILQHKTELATVFEAMRSKKDSTTLVNKKTISDDSIALICSCIYDVIKYILQEMEEEDYMSLIDDNVPGKAIHNMMKEMVLSGGFMQVIRDIFEENISLRSNTGFEIICNLREQFSIKKSE